MTEIAIDKHGWKILELLGIETKNAVKAVIKIKLNDLMTVEITHLVKIDGNFVLNKDETDIERVLKRYELKEIKDETEKVGNDKWKAWCFSCQVKAGVHEGTGKAYQTVL